MEEAGQGAQTQAEVAEVLAALAALAELAGELHWFHCLDLE
jgi:hypothetical protein